MSELSLLWLSYATKETKSGHLPTAFFSLLLYTRHLLGFMWQNPAVFCSSQTLKPFVG